MNSDSSENEEKDTFHFKSLNIVPSKQHPLQIKGSPPLKYPSLSLMLQPIPIELFFPFKTQLFGSIPLYCNQPSIEYLNKNQPVYLCFHGAGHSALVFGHLAKQMKSVAPLFSYDIMCHGYSKVQTSEQSLDINSICKQALSVIKFMINTFRFTNFVLLGHSLGGSIATRIASIIDEENKGCIIGVVMIDTIEDLVYKCKQQMMKFINQRPQTFESIQSSIKWHYKAGCVKRLEAARYSVPSMITKLQNGRYGWKIDMAKTQGYWGQWFNGISRMFRGLPCKKLMMTTSKFRLDQCLLEGLEKQEFELELFNYSGHNIQQDQFEKMARILQDLFNTPQ